MKPIFLPVLHLFSGLLVTPGAALAYYFWSIEGAIRQGNLIKLAFFVLIRIAQTMEWAILIMAPALIAWLVLAFLAKYRWIGAAGMSLAAVATLVGFLVSVGPARTITEGSIFTGAVVAGMAINL